MFDAERKKDPEWELLPSLAGYATICVPDMSRNFDPLYTLVVATQSSDGACFYTNICIRLCICVCDNHTTVLS